MTDENLKAAKKQPSKKKRELGEGDLLKAVIRSGEESGTPKDGDLVIFHCTTYSEEVAIMDSTRAEHGGNGRPQKLVLGKSKMIAGWEEGLPTMSKGEVSRFKVRAKLHYGDPECPVPVPESFPTSGDLQFDIEMINFFKVKVVTDDFGVLKQVLTDGEGWETPRVPYEVRVRITGQIPGGATFFERKEEPLHFRFGNKELPDGLEQGIGTMTKSEKAIIYVSRSYITEASAIPELPTQAQEIEFEVEVLQVIQVRDMLGDGSVMKRRLRDGEGEFPVDCPLHDSTLRIHYKGRLPSEGFKVFIDTREKDGGKPVEFNSGEGMVPEGLEMCVRLMLPGEVSVVNSISKYAYDKFTRPPLVPEGASVQWEVELVSFDKRKDWTGFTFKEIMEDAEKQKATGNRLFKEGKIELAKAKYEFILREFKHVNPDGEDETKELSNAQISLQLNVAACHQKLADHVKAIELCNKVLEGNPYHVKALFRRGTSYTASGDFEEARNDFKQMMNIEKSSIPDATAALAKLKKAEKEAEMKARKQFKGLFDKQPGILSQPEEETSKEKLTSVQQDVDEEHDAVRKDEENVVNSSYTPSKLQEAGIRLIRRLTFGRCSIL